jgi:dihydrolipoamide dehydrogenase
LKSAQVFHYINHAEDYGLNKVEASFEFPNVIQRSRGVASKMSKGIEFLMKKNKIDVILGTAKVQKGKKVSVTDKEGKVTEYTGTTLLSQQELVQENYQTYLRMVKK